MLVLGAGEQGELTARALHESGVRTVFIANRRYDRAIGLAQRFDGEAVRFDDLPAELAVADIVLSCTASPHQILGRDEMAVVAEDRGTRPLLMIDIAVPRDIDPTVREVCGITLYDMDDLQREVAINMSGREAEAEGSARSSPRRPSDSRTGCAGSTWCPRSRRSASAVRTSSAGARGQRRALGDLAEADRNGSRPWAARSSSRMLHEPTLRLKQAAEEESSYVFIQTMRELMGLDGAELGAGGAEVSSLESAGARAPRAPLAL